MFWYLPKSVERGFRISRTRSIRVAFEADGVDIT